MNTKDIEFLVSKDDPELEYDLIEKIGQGNYGTVYKALHKKTGKIYAAKIASIGLNINNNLSTFKKEINVLSQCDSPYIVSYYNSYIKNYSLWIILEYCDGGSLLDLINILERGLNEEQIASITYMILQGLSFLHENKKIHRDVKTGNILLTREGLAKLGDFGVSAQLMHSFSKKISKIGTPFYMAPETIMQSKYDFECDIWSLGITVIEMAEREPPFSKVKPYLVLKKILTNPPTGLKNKEKWSKEFNDFVEKCLIFEHTKRPSAKELLQHPFIVKNNKGSKLISELINNSLDDLAFYRKKILESDGENDDDDDEEENSEDCYIFKNNKNVNIVNNESYNYNNDNTGTIQINNGNKNITGTMLQKETGTMINLENLNNKDNMNVDYEGEGEGEDNSVIINNNANIQNNQLLFDSNTNNINEENNDDGSVNINDNDKNNDLINMINMYGIEGLSVGKSNNNEGTNNSNSHSSAVCKDNISNFSISSSNKNNKFHIRNNDDNNFEFFIPKHLTKKSNSYNNKATLLAEETKMSEYHKNYKNNNGNNFGYNNFNQYPILTDYNNNEKNKNCSLNENINKNLNNSNDFTNTHKRINILSNDIEDVINDPTINGLTSEQIQNQIIYYKKEMENEISKIRDKYNKIISKYTKSLQFLQQNHFLKNINEYKDYKKFANKIKQQIFIPNNNDNCINSSCNNNNHISKQENEINKKCNEGNVKKNLEEDEGGEDNVINTDKKVSNSSGVNNKNKNIIYIPNSNGKNKIKNENNVTGNNNYDYNYNSFSGNYSSSVYSDYSSMKRNDVIVCGYQPNNISIKNKMNK